MWSGALNFGLVNVPIKLFTAIQEKRVHFHLVHDADGARIREKRVCSKDGKEVPYAHVSRAFELAKGKHVVLTPEELEQLAVKANRACEIEAFVDLASIDPVLFDSTYYAVPDKHAVKPYQLLVEAMRRSAKAGIARIILRTRESLCAVRPTGDGLAITTLHYANEVRSHRDLDEMPAKVARSFSEKELKMANQLIESLSGEFEPSRHKDQYRERVLALVGRKSKGQEVVSEAEAPAPVQVVDLVDALERSLAAKTRHGHDAARPSLRPHRASGRRARRRHG